MTLGEMIAASMSVREIAAALGISRGATFKRARKLGGTLNRQGYPARYQRPKGEVIPAEAVPANLWRFTDDARAARAEPSFRYRPPTHRHYATSAADMANA